MVIIANIVVASLSMHPGASIAESLPAAIVLWNYMDDALLKKPIVIPIPNKELLVIPNLSPVVAKALCHSCAPELC